MAITLICLVTVQRMQLTLFPFQFTYYPMHAFLCLFGSPHFFVCLPVNIKFHLRLFLHISGSGGVSIVSCPQMVLCSE